MDNNGIPDLDLMGPSVLPGYDWVRNIAGEEITQEELEEFVRDYNAWCKETGNE